MGGRVHGRETKGVRVLGRKGKWGGEDVLAGESVYGTGRMHERERECIEGRESAWEGECMGERMHGRESLWDGGRGHGR